MRAVSPRFMACRSDLERARFVVYGIPFEGRVNLRKGADSGPRDLRLTSDSIETYSPALGRDLEHLPLADIGDCELPDGAPPREQLDAARGEIAAWWRPGLIPFMLGGDHTATVPVMEAIAPTFPGLRVLQLDAHPDTREEFLGERYNYASAMARGRAESRGLGGAPWAGGPPAGPRPVARKPPPAGSSGRLWWGGGAISGGEPLPPVRRPASLRDRVRHEPQAGGRLPRPLLQAPRHDPGEPRARHRMRDRAAPDPPRRPRVPDVGARPLGREHRIRQAAARRQGAPGRADRRRHERLPARAAGGRGPLYAGLAGSHAYPSAAPPPPPGGRARRPARWAPRLRPLHGLLLDEPGPELVVVQAPRAAHRARFVLGAQRRGPGEPDLPRANDAGGDRKRHAAAVPPVASLADGLPARAQGARRAGRRLRVRPVVLRVQAPPGLGALQAPPHDGCRPAQDLSGRAAMTPAGAPAARRPAERGPGLRPQAGGPRA